MTQALLAQTWQYCPMWASRIYKERGSSQLTYYDGVSFSTPYYQDTFRGVVLSKFAELIEQSRSQYQTTFGITNNSKFGGRILQTNNACHFIFVPDRFTLNRSDTFTFPIHGEEGEWLVFENDTVLVTSQLLETYLGESPEGQDSIRKSKLVAIDKVAKDTIVTEILVSKKFGIMQFPALSNFRSSPLGDRNLTLTFLAFDEWDETEFSQPEMHLSYNTEYPIRFETGSVWIDSSGKESVVHYTMTDELSTKSTKNSFSEVKPYQDAMGLLQSTKLNDFLDGGIPNPGRLVFTGNNRLFQVALRPLCGGFIYSVSGLVGISSPMPSSDVITYPKYGLSNMRRTSDSTIVGYNGSLDYESCGASYIRIGRKYMPVSYSRYYFGSRLALEYFRSGDCEDGEPIPLRVRGISKPLAMIFPNPSSDHLTIKGFSHDGNAVIIDMQGNSEAVEVRNGRVDIKSLSSGPYVIQFQFADQIWTTKFNKI